MRRHQLLAATAALALALGSPALAQRGSQGGDRGRSGRDDAGAGRSQPRGGDADRGRPRGNISIADRLNVGAPPTTLPGLGSASLITPRPGVDAFRAGPGTYDAQAGGVITPRGPSWGGAPLSSAPPSWGGVPVNRPEPGKRDDDRDDRGRRRRPSRHQSNGYVGGYGGLYGVPWGFLPYGVGVSSEPTVAAPPSSAAPAQALIPDGFLRLLVTPRDAAVIIDGVVAGTVDDFGGTREQAITAGPHRVRIEAYGYEPVDFDVRVPAGDTISLRRDLTPVPPPPRPPEPGASGRAAPSQVPAVKKTFYAIPRCYLGDSMPSAETLPPGCSLKDLRVLPQ